MARRTADPPVREQKRTALMVGEGLGDEAFLRHLKSLYFNRGDMRITIKNAKGKGGAHVLDFTHRQCQVADYDLRLALLDTDTDWGPEQRREQRNGASTSWKRNPAWMPCCCALPGPSQPPRRPGARKPSPGDSTPRRIRPGCTNATSRSCCWRAPVPACRSWIN